VRSTISKGPTRIRRVENGQKRRAKPIRGPVRATDGTVYPAGWNPELGLLCGLCRSPLPMIGLSRGSTNVQYRNVRALCPNLNCRAVNNVDGTYSWP
jgi:hypothetical protein